MFAAYVKSQIVWINITNKTKMNKLGVLNWAWSMAPKNQLSQAHVVLKGDGG